jgi:hypothetical protein
VRRAITFIGALALVAGFAGCGDDAVCGPPEGADPDGIGATTPGGPVTWGDFDSSPNNDCGMQSLSVHGFQATPVLAGGITPPITLCIPQPSAIGADPITPGFTDDDTVRLVDFAGGDAEDCTFTVDRDVALAMTVAFTGFCDDGANAAGYGISRAGSVAVKRDCAGTITDATVQLSGTAPVSPAPL